MPVHASSRDASFGRAREVGSFGRKELAGSRPWHGPRRAAPRAPSTPSAIGLLRMRSLRPGLAYLRRFDRSCGNPGALCVGAWALSPAAPVRAPVPGWLRTTWSQTRQHTRCFLLSYCDAHKLQTRPSAGRANQVDVFPRCGDNAHVSETHVQSTLRCVSHDPICSSHRRYTTYDVCIHIPDPTRPSLRAGKPRSYATAHGGVSACRVVSACTANSRPSACQI